MNLNIEYVDAAHLKETAALYPLTSSGAGPWKLQPTYWLRHMPVHCTRTVHRFGAFLRDLASLELVKNIDRRPYFKGNWTKRKTRKRTKCTRKTDKTRFGGVPWPCSAQAGAQTCAVAYGRGSCVPRNLKREKRPAASGEHANVQYCTTYLDL